MSASPLIEQRILVLAPTGRDAALACEVLNGAGLFAEACADASALCQQVEAGAGAVLLADEALSPRVQERLSEVLKRQASWSDLPLVIFATPVDTDASVIRMQRMLEILGNVTFIERPVRVVTLVTAMKAALRARSRQYIARQTLLSLERQEEASRTRAAFEEQLIGIVSHDLRNPIHVITLSAATLLRREGMTDRAKGIVTRILSSADRAKRMIHDLLDFTQARLGSGIPIRRAPLDFHELSRHTLDEVMLAYPDREVSLTATGDSRGEWDADRIAQVLSNLVTNAMAYSPKETPVQISLRGEPESVTLEIHNAGTPIPAERVSELFQPMQRAVTNAGNVSRSVGLGLYIVKHIVAAHGGTIDVRSTEAEGTAFSVTLPRRAAAVSS